MIAKRKSAKKAKSAKRAPKRKSAPKKKARPKIVKRAAKRPLKKANRAVKKSKRSKPSKHTAQRSSRSRERQQARAKLAQQLIGAPTTSVEEHKPIPKYPLLPDADSERVRMLQPVLRELARKHVITDWRINLAHTRSANLYLGADLTLEDDLRATREDVIVTIYRRFEDGTIGEAQVPILTSDAAMARDELTAATELAGVARKPAFDLPEPVEGIEFPHGYDQNVLDAFHQGNGGKVPLSVLEELRTQLALVKDVRLASAEILTSAITARVANSNGVDVSFHRTGLYLDLVFVSKGKVDEQEFHWAVDVVSPDQLDLRTTIPREAQRARDALAAVPNPGFTGGVLLSGEALRDYMAPSNAPNPLVMHAHARLKAMGLSRLTLGQPTGVFRGEPFTLSSNPTVPNGTLSIPVDEEGVALTPFDIVRTGVFQQWVAGPRYAKELDVPLTGNVANVQVSAGATREEHLRGNQYVEIVSFSWFNPDLVSGDYSAEIRLGYLWVQGRATPLRGGHLVGNVFNDLLDARFSREVMLASRYYGPRAVLFRSGNVTKGA